MEDALPFDPRPGRPATVAPGVRRILAPNPSPMTFRGTNTYLIGTGDLTLIDPGPAAPSHLDAILSTLGPGERIGRILITHSHLDHSALAPLLRAATGAAVLAYGDSRAGRSAIMARLAAEGMTGGGEGVDRDFQPDGLIADNEVLETSAGPLIALHTPGHFGNHLSFRLGAAIFSGDLAMGWSSSVVSPPDGDLRAYMTSLDRLAATGARRLLPGHGPAVEAAGARLAVLITHRREREAQILDALGPAPMAIRALTRRIYRETPPALLPAAERNVLAHLIDLHARGAVRALPRPGPKADWTLS